MARRSKKGRLVYDTRTIYPGPKAGREANDSGDDLYKGSIVERGADPERDVACPAQPVTPPQTLWRHRDRGTRPPKTVSLRGLLLADADPHIGRLAPGLAPLAVVMGRWLLTRRRTSGQKYDIARLVCLPGPSYIGDTAIRSAVARADGVTASAYMTADMSFLAFMLENVMTGESGLDVARARRRSTHSISRVTYHVVGHPGKPGRQELIMGARILDNEGLLAGELDQFSRYDNPGRRVHDNGMTLDLLHAFGRFGSTEKLGQEIKEAIGPHVPESTVLSPLRVIAPSDTPYT